MRRGASLFRSLVSPPHLTVSQLILYVWLPGEERDPLGGRLRRRRTQIPSKHTPPAKAGLPAFLIQMANGKRLGPAAVQEPRPPKAEPLLKSVAGSSVSHANVSDSQASPKAVVAADGVCSGDRTALSPAEPVNQVPLWAVVQGTHSESQTDAHHRIFRACRGESRKPETKASPPFGQRQLLSCPAISSNLGTTFKWSKYPPWLQQVRLGSQPHSTLCHKGSSAGLPSPRQGHQGLFLLGLPRNEWSLIYHLDAHHPEKHHLLHQEPGK